MGVSSDSSDLIGGSLGLEEECGRLTSLGSMVDVGVVLLVALLETSESSMPV